VTFRLRVGYVGWVPHPQFLETAGADPALEIVKIPFEASTDEAVQQLSSCHAYYVMAARDELPKPLHVTSELLAKLPNLLMAASYGAGYDPCDPIACTEAGVLLLNQAGGNAEGVAEHAVGMMLACLKRMPDSHAMMKAGNAFDRGAQMGRDIKGMTVGLVGFGNVGRRTAQILQLAFGCEVIACDPYVDAAVMAHADVRKVELPELYALSDVVSLHCPLTPETRGLVGAEAFAAMKKRVVFVTTARGSIHDEAALFDALQSGQVAGAGLDVWEQEPPPADHPLLHHPNVIASQHIAGVTEQSRANITHIAALAFGDVAHGRLPPRIINPEVLPVWKERYRQATGFSLD
jgi:D-3-phosphoglycerate dehydrogenase